MKLSMRSAKASNGVDRGEPTAPLVQGMLSFFYDRHDGSDAPWRREATQTLVGMVEADTSEILAPGYLKHVARARGFEFPSRALDHRGAVAYAKGALVRGCSGTVAQQCLGD